MVQPLTVDSCGTVIYPSLSQGGALHLVSKERALDGRELAEYLRREQIECLKIAPSHLGALAKTVGVEALLPRGQLIIGGEASSWEFVERLAAAAAGNCRVFNHYGPTETTVGILCYEVGEERGATGNVPLGRPLGNMEAYVLDGELEVVPAGVLGELYLGGEAVGRGYLGRVELTAEKFVPHLYSARPGQRLYRSGDVGRYGRDGNIEYVGRRDEQVKVRGFRVELGEIEAALREHEQVSEALVVAQGEAGAEQRLVGYVVWAAGAAVGVEELRKFLRQRLPEYMAPAALVELSELPLTPHGKVDRQALPKPAEMFSGEQEYEAARTATEEIVAGIWQDVIRVERVGVHDNFFELGGHSLLATQVISRVRKVFQIELPLRRLFERPTVAELAEAIERVIKAGEPLLVPAVERRSRADELPLSFAQQRLWFLDQMEPGNTVYNIPLALRLHGELDITALERSLSEVVRRHEVLRTTFRSIEGRAVQVIGEAEALTLPLIDLSELPKADAESKAKQLAGEEATGSFNLATGPLLRVKLLRMSVDEHVLLCTLHHIVSDGWSRGVLTRETVRLYKAFKAGAPSPLPELEIQYADYAVWQREWLQGEALQEQIDYWKKQLADVPAVLDLPTDYPRPAVRGYRGAYFPFSLSPSLSAELKAVSRREGVTLFMSLLAVFQVLLSRYSGQSEIVVGTPIANRTRTETEGLIGFFVNTLALRTSLAEASSWQTLLKEVREVCLGAYAHQEVPFEKLVEELQPMREMSHSPLFQVMLMLQNANQEAFELEGLRLNVMGGAGESVKFDLTISLQDVGGSLRGSIAYSTELFAAETIKRLAAHYEQLLSEMVSQPSQLHQQAAMLTAAEREQLLVEWNQTKRDFAADKCLHQFLEDQAGRTPKRIALVYEEQQLAYGELNARANQLAHHLRTLGVNNETVVGIVLDRSPEMVIALFGVLKAGAAYVPLDAAYPKERLAGMIAGVQVPVLLTHTSLLPSLPEHDARVICLDGDWQTIAQHSTENIDGVVTAQNLAYVLYTSGSTGKPKGAGVTHRGFVNLLNWFLTEFNITADDNVLLVSSFSFDLTQKNFYAPLAVGGQLHLMAHGYYDPDAIVQAVSSKQINLLNCTPSAFYPLLEAAQRKGFSELASLRCLFLGGEPISVSLLSEWINSPAFKADIVNTYGPTECTDICAFHRLSNFQQYLEAPVPIGEPVFNAQLLILNAALELVPVGATGELCVAGTGVGRGYVNDVELTSRKFVPHPFSQEPGARLYQTGDLARYLPNGLIEFVGRVDDQVKVRGYRIELGEIEGALRQHADVREAVVVAREDVAGEKRLVAYLVAAEVADDAGEINAAVIDLTELRAYLRQLLPEYMVPSVFVTLAELPLTPSGKVDRRALPSPQQAGTVLESSDVMPGTPTEEILAGIWIDMLPVEQLGVHDNFFDLGGHSLLATRMIFRVREAFRVELPLRRIFEQPTIVGLAKDIDAAIKAGQDIPTTPITRAPRIGELPLSYTQQRAWFAEQLDTSGMLGSQLYIQQMSGPLDVVALERSLNEIVRRHEVLRTTFSSRDGVPFQVVAPSLTLAIPLKDLSTRSENKQKKALLEIIMEERKRPFDLTAGPLLRVTLVRLSARDHVFIIVTHHIVSDLWSRRILIGEFQVLYTAYESGRPSPLPELTVQYADFAYWQRQQVHGKAWALYLDYWRKLLGDALPIMKLPTKSTGVQNDDSHLQSIRFVLSESLSDRINEFSRREGLTIFMSLWTGFQVLLHRYTEQETIIALTNIAGRGQPETEKMIGCFFNVLVLYAKVSGQQSFKELAGLVKERTLEAYSRQDLPYDKLLDELTKEWKLNTRPQLQVKFDYLNPWTSARSANRHAQLSVKRLNTESETEGEVVDLETDLGNVNTADLGITLSGGDVQAIRGTLVYKSGLFEAATMKRMLRHYEQLLEQMCANVDQPIWQVQLLTDAERQQLLVEWNQTQRAYPRDLCLHHLFEAQVERTPKAVAVVFGEERLTYRELNARANQLAHHLSRHKGVVPETLVGVCMASSLELVTAMLGVLKAGGAYVLLDSSYPPQQLSHMVKNAGLRLLLAQQRSLVALPADAVETVYLSEDWPAIASEPRNAPAVPAKPENAAYVSYTSGSTGPAKAVVISHQASCNYMRWMQDNFPLGKSDRVLQLTPLTSHAAAWEFFGPLQGGAQLLLTDAQSVENLKEEIGRLRVTALQLTPTLIRRILEKQAQGRSLLGRVLDKGDKKWARSLKYVFNHGELLSNRLAADLAERIPCEVHNLYGAAEVASNASAGKYELGNGADVAIGRPIANVEMYVLDEQLQPVPIGLSGQLYIGGAALARGYLMQPDLTAEKFIPHPFSSQPGARLYQTGDMACFTPDGNLQFVGKREGQRRVKGLWIGLGVIEAALLDQPGVSEAFVVTRAEGGEDARLVAYVVLNQETPPKGGELRRELKQRLPAYMVPTDFVRLTAMPLLPGGKVDRLALPAPKRLGKTRPGDDRWIDHGDGTEKTVNLQREALDSRKSDLSAAKRVLLEQRLRRKDPGKVSAQGPSATARARKAPSSSLVRIQPKGSKRPLFCVHEVDGLCLAYADLARHLGSKQPVYGLQSKGLQQDEAVETDLPAMARNYIEDMRVVQPHGPYLIAGWSMGGVLAFEMSRQIRMQGDSIDLLAVIDTPTPRLFSQNLPVNQVGFLLDLIGAFVGSAERLAIIGEELRQLEPDEQVRFVLNMAIKARIVEQSMTLSLFKKFMGVYQANKIAMHNYEAQPYDVKVVLFRGESSSSARWESPLLGWGELASGGVEERIVPGNHQTMMFEPNVGKLAAQLQELMKQGEAKHP